MRFQRFFGLSRILLFFNILWINICQIQASDYRKLQIQALNSSSIVRAISPDNAPCYDTCIRSIGESIPIVVLILGFHQKPTIEIQLWHENTSRALSNTTLRQCVCCAFVTPTIQEVHDSGPWKGERICNNTLEKAIMVAQATLVITLVHEERHDAKSILWIHMLEKQSRMNECLHGLVGPSYRVCCGFQ